MLSKVTDKKQHFIQAREHESVEEREFKLSRINKYIWLSNKPGGKRAGLFSGGGECWHLSVKVFQ